ncbi:MAG: hypothetical protein CL908_23530 [Deltaproteobacteria bacterium]|nr:hypothetical protein [Deltaproteobacteria bacterium]
MLFSASKKIRQLAAVIGSGNLLFLKLALKNRAAARVFPGEMYRSYLGLTRGTQWPCLPVFELLPKVDRIRAMIEHVPSEAIDTPLEQLSSCC